MSINAIISLRKLGIFGASSLRTPLLLLLVHLLSLSVTLAWTVDCPSVMALSTRVAVTSSRRRGCALLVLLVALALLSREARGGPWQVAERRPCASPVSALRPAARLPPRCLELRGGAGPECETEDAAGLAHDMAKLSTDQAGGEKRENVNLVMVGHVDAGKSTICGHLLYLSGQLDQRTMDKFIRESEALGRSSWKFAWAMDLTEEERAKGKTQEVGQAHIETEKRRYTLLDAPGHKNYVPNMVRHNLSRSLHNTTRMQ